MSIPERETEAGIKLRVAELEADNARLQGQVFDREAEVDGLVAERDRLREQVEEAEGRYCNPCRSAGETPLSKAVYICFWCEDGFCHDHAAKHFGAEHSGRSDLTRERDRYKAQSERRREALESYRIVFGKCYSRNHPKWVGWLQLDVDRDLFYTAGKLAGAAIAAEEEGR